MGRDENVFSLAQDPSVWLDAIHIMAITRWFDPRMLMILFASAYILVSLLMFQA